MFQEFLLHQQTIAWTYGFCHTVHCTGHRSQDELVSVWAAGVNALLMPLRSEGIWSWHNSSTPSCKWHSLDCPGKLAHPRSGWWPHLREGEQRHWKMTQLVFKVLRCTPVSGRMGPSFWPWAPSWDEKDAGLDGVSVWTSTSVLPHEFALRINVLIYLLEIFSLFLFLSYPHCSFCLCSSPPQKLPSLGQGLFHRFSHLKLS